eukprot:m.774928 g.774928  ORF g.774928 m.774928 type:complete len:52 (-) comp23257_c0_seq40:3587-3742(-)
MHATESNSSASKKWGRRERLAFAELLVVQVCEFPNFALHTVILAHLENLTG